MEKYYIIADLSREPSSTEDLPTPGALVALGRMKAVVEADTWQEAMEKGKELITGCLKRTVKVSGWGWMTVEGAKKMGDTAIYEAYSTATKLTYYRIKAGLTQAQLSERSGVNIRQIQRVEGGTSSAGNLTAKNLLAIADALGVDPRELI